MKTFIQFSKYSSIAILSSLCDWVIFIALDLMGANLIHAQLAARLGGGVFSFLANRNWNFQSDRIGHVTRQGRRFLVLYLFSYALSISLIYFFIRIIEFPAYPSKLGADSLCFIVNFIVMRGYVYKDRRGITDGLQKMLRTLVKTS